MSRTAISQAEMRRRSKQVEILLTAAHTLRSFGRFELSDEINHLAEQVRTGKALPDKNTGES
jgi:hypothetical protein